jgi:tRNA pseudouridine32 synthase/23S rRNA pseudouridine746 synthase
VTRLEILVADGALVAVDKPPGLPVIPGRQGEGEHVRGVLEAQLGRRVFVVHRLDRDTSGVLLFALEADLHRRLSIAFERGEVKKRYLALVRGDLSAPARLELPLTAGRKGRMRVARPGETGKPSVTEVRPLERLRGATLVEAEPLTGRTHQIRVHLAAVGHPLLVDHQYGGEAPPDFEALISRTPLHAASVTLPEGASGPRVIEAPLPADFTTALARLRDPR